MTRPKLDYLPGDPDWHLQGWMAHFGKRQADIIADLGIERGRVSKIYNGRQPYTRALINQMARWLEIAPYELLMPPAEAIALRRLRETAHMIAAEDQRRDWVPAQPGQPGARAKAGGG